MQAYIKNSWQEVVVVRENARTVMVTLKKSTDNKLIKRKKSQVRESQAVESPVEVTAG